MLCIDDKMTFVFVLCEFLRQSAFSNTSCSLNKHGALAIRRAFPSHECLICLAPEEHGVLLEN